MRARQAGFTLVEIMIVIAIIAGVLVIGVPKMFSTQTTMRAAIRKLAVMSRDVRNNSRLYTVTTRFVFTMDREKKSFNYAVESSPGVVLLKSEEAQKEFDSLTESQKAEVKTSVDFKEEARVLKKPIDLPKGMMFEDIEKVGKDAPVNTGKAYINFYPSGLAEEAAIHISDGKDLHWTIVINPLTGRADVYEKRITLKEVRAL